MGDDCSNRGGRVIVMVLMMMLSVMEGMGGG